MPKPKRPKSDGRCIHCRLKLAEETEDHVFPRSWYPESTPADVQRWTVPSCRPCNGKSGGLENEVFVPLALCVNPLKVAAAGLSKRAIRALGIGAASDLSERDKRARQAVRARVFKEAKPYSPEIQPHILPGLGPHPEVPASLQLQITIPADKLQAVFGKIVRGCEYWLADGRIVEPPYDVSVHFVHDADVPSEIIRAFAPFGPVYLGPGFRVRRAAVVDHPLTVLYETVLWDTLKFYAFIAIAPKPALEASNYGAK